MTLQKYYRTIVECGFYTNEKRLRQWINTLFGGIDFKDKNVLDIGGGVGKYAFYAAAMGAARITILEPEGAGCKGGTIKNFELLKSKFPEFDNILFIPTTFQNFTSDKRFDIIYLTSSINHLDEVACIKLLTDVDSKRTYEKLFEKMSNLCNPRADLLFSGCGRSNFFGDTGIRNFFAPNLEWEKHQDPGVWIKLLKPFGFEITEKKWRAPNRYGKLGKLLLANRVVSYFTSSNFYVKMKKLPVKEPTGV